MKGSSHGAAIAATTTTIAGIAATTTTIAGIAATTTTIAAIAATETTTPTPDARKPSAQPRTIAIIGGGFSGTSLAIHLLRQPYPTGAQLVIIDPQEQPGPGLAYATRDYPYPLNVAAAQMSLDPAHPADFLEFLGGQGIQAAGGDYLPRQVFGDYLRERFQAAARDSTGLRASHRRGRVLQLRRTADGGWDLWLDDGTVQRADIVVLALGNPPPARLPEFAPIANSRHYVDDPWSIGECAHENIDSVLLVGSGLTMIDAALRLAAIRPRAHHIHVLSRHGLLPQSQATDSRPPLKPELREAVGADRPSALSRALRAKARDVHAAGGDWREIVATLRPQLPTLWRDLDEARRGRFLRHLRSYWEVHRHRVPAGPLAAVRSLERLGVLEVHAGRIESMRILEDSVEVTWRPRGAQRSRAWLVDRVVNCTGPDMRVTRNPDPLVQSLLAGGWIRADAQGLGIEVGADSRVLSRTGAPVDSLYYLGPWLRTRDWEATAVPELREHAVRLARDLVASLARSATPAP
jgi:uncharacterized NAD(P)/FAD-binding protein YdhS